MNEYDGKQFVGIDLHRQRSVIVRQSESGEQLSAVRIVNDPVALGLQLEQAGPNPEVVLEATYGWYWAVDVLQAAGDTHHQALRAAGNRLVGILHGCLRHHRPYDEHTAWAHRTPAAA